MLIVLFILWLLIPGFLKPDLDNIYLDTQGVSGVSPRGIFESKGILDIHGKIEGRPIRVKVPIGSVTFLYSNEEHTRLIVKNRHEPLFMSWQQGFIRASAVTIIVPKEDVYIWQRELDYWMANLRDQITPKRVTPSEGN